MLGKHNFQESTSPKLEFASVHSEIFPRHSQGTTLFGDAAQSSLNLHGEREEAKADPEQRSAVEKAGQNLESRVQSDCELEFQTVERQL